MMTEEDEDESPHMDTDKTDEEVQHTGPAFDNNLDNDVADIAIEEDDHVFMSFCPCFEHGVRTSRKCLPRTQS
jgi:hypothetical protein